MHIYIYTYIYIYIHLAKFYLGKMERADLKFSLKICYLCVLSITSFSFYCSIIDFQGANSVRAYFPEDRWYEYYTVRYAIELRYFMLLIF